MKLQLIFFLSLCSATLLAAQTPKEYFDQGNAAYNGGNYQLAVEKYTSILQTEVESPALYFNLGNAHYRLGNVAESIFYFEKAHALSPSDQSIRNNKGFAKNMLLDAIEELPQTQLDQWQFNIINKLSLDGWSYLTLGLVWIGILLLGIYMWTQGMLFKRLFFALGIFMLFLSGISWRFSHQKKKSQSQISAVIFDQEIEVWTEPNTRSEVVFTLHEGTVLQVLEDLEGWSKINIANGASGWIKNRGIRRLDQPLW